MSARKYLSSDEIELLINAVPKGEYYHRDRCLILMSYIHGLRVSELRHLKVSDIANGTIFIQRLKSGLSTTHPLQEREIEELQCWLAKRSSWLNNDMSWLFLSRHGLPLSRQRIFDMFRRYGELAGLPVAVHPHMLRHSCGFALANGGKDTRLIQDYLGHRNIQHTVLYTACNPERFNSVVL